MILNEHFTLYDNCLLCPRKCGVNRYDTVGFCRESAALSIDAALIHFGEEPPISFKKGSGTIFFTGCSLRCPFCQNMQISQNPKNRNFYSMKDFIIIMEDLVSKGVENLNFVTPDHFLPHILEGLKHLKKNGINITTIYNCSGFQTIDNLEMASEYIDIFLFDYKFGLNDCSLYCINNEDYPSIALDGLKFLMKKKGGLVLSDEGKGVSGVLVRHLVLPSFIDNSIEVLNNLYFNFGNSVYLSLMSQYSPIYLKSGYEKINRKLSPDEYDTIVELAFNFGFDNGYIQEYMAGDDQYIPDFEKKKMFENW